MSNFRIYNQSLCPALWDEQQHLDPEVRLGLLKLAYDFYEKTGFKAPIVDVYLMGSIANYNWTSESDADVHVIIDYNQLQMPEETATEVIKTAGSQWNAEHEATVKGHKVELNIQNAREKKPHVTGIYSLVHDQWIRQPQYQARQFDTMTIQAKYKGMRKYLESTLRSGDRQAMKAAKKYLDAFRQYGLDTGGELSIENIVFKIIRSKGLIKALKDGITTTYDKEMSVKEGDEVYPPDARFGLGAIGSNDEVIFKEFPRDTFSNQAHGKGGNPFGRRRFRYAGGTVEWSDCSRPDQDQINLVNTYLDRRGFPVKQHTSIYDKDSDGDLTEVGMKDLKQSLPQRPSQYKYEDSGDLRLDKMTMDNLAALRSKVARAIAYMRKLPEVNPSDMAREVKEFQRISQEMKRRMDYINNPVAVPEGYGAGDPTKDPLATGRWRVKFGGRKTPLLKEEFSPSIDQPPSIQPSRPRKGVDLFPPKPLQGVPEEVKKIVADAERILDKKYKEGHKFVSVEDMENLIEDLIATYIPNLPKDVRYISLQKGIIMWLAQDYDIRYQGERLLTESPEMKTLKKNKKPLTDEERQLVMSADATWHHGPNGEKTPAVWKSIIKGKTWYVCNTHRAMQVKPTIKGAISAFKFIKTTA